MAYKITIQSDNGRTVHINAGTGLDGNLDPISGVDVQISASQGANQIGESITDQTVGSVVRTISGECRTPAAAKELLRAVPPLSKGKLILNDAYFCEYVVKRSPYVTREKGSRNKRTFSTILYCRLPYWQSITPSSCLIGGYTPSFRFPVTYAKPHRFGTRSPFAFVNALNPGDFQAAFSAVFSTAITTKNPVLLNCVTGAKLRLITDLVADEQLKVYRDSDGLHVEKVSAGKVEDVFACLDDDSSLFYLEPGDNLLKIDADDGAENLQCSVSYNAAYMGVYPDDF